MDALVSFLICCSLVVLFVGLLYVSQRSRGSDKDSPEVIQARFISVGTSCVLSTLIAIVCLPSTPYTWFHQMGLLPSAFGIFTPMLLIVILFSGPLLQSYLDDPMSWRPNALWRDLRHGMTQWVWWRNFVVAPTSEEWVFRGVMVPLLSAGGWSTTWQSLLPPLLFGIAHTHHILSSHLAWKKAILVASFQVFYTTLFGWIAARFFIMTNCLWGPVLSHAFCNMMGFPDIEDALGKPLVLSVYVAGIVLFITGMVML